MLEHAVMDEDSMLQHPTACYSMLLWKKEKQIRINLYQSKIAHSEWLKFRMSNKFEVNNFFTKADIIFSRTFHFDSIQKSEKTSNDHEKISDNAEELSFLTHVVSWLYDNWKRNTKRFCEFFFRYQVP